MDKNELKVEALRQRISEITTQYEDRIADLRIEITFLTQDKQQLEQRVTEFEQQQENMKAGNVQEEANNLTTVD